MSRSNFLKGILNFTANGKGGLDIDTRPKSPAEDESGKTETPSIDDMRKALDFLQKCDKFWTCVADRDLSPRPKHKHCFLPRDMRD